MEAAKPKTAIGAVNDAQHRVERRDACGASDSNAGLGANFGEDDEMD